MYRSIGNIGFACAALFLVVMAGCGKSDDGIKLNLGLMKLDKPAPGTPLEQLGPTTDANEAVKRMFATYHGVRSLHVETSADIEMSYSGHLEKSHQSAIIRFQRNPDRLWMRTLDMRTGTVEFIGEDGSFITYIGANNTYKRQTVPVGLSEQLQAIDKNTPQLLSPIQVLLKKDPASVIQSARMLAPARILGKDAYVIAGQITPQAVRTFGENTNLAQGMAIVGAGYKLWINKGDYMLLQAEVDLSWKGEYRPKEGQVTIKNPTIHFIERTVAVVPNPAFASDAFHFRPPSGAKERFVERFGE